VWRAVAALVADDHVIDGKDCSILAAIRQHHVRRSVRAPDGACKSAGAHEHDKMPHDKLSHENFNKWVRCSSSAGLPAGVIVSLPLLEVAETLNPRNQLRMR